MRWLKRTGTPEIFAALFALALQAQITLFQTGDYEGLRLSAADFLIPFAGITILASLLRRRTVWPIWARPFGWTIPVALTAVMTLALLNGYRVQGSLQNWALVNKFLGWFILMAYLGAGAWLATNYRDRILPVFIKFFCGFFLLVAVLEIINQWFLTLDINLGPREGWEPIRGLMDNRNAFGFLLLSFLALCHFCTFGSEKSTNLVRRLAWAIIPILFLFNGSRSLWIGAAILLPVLVILDGKKFLRIALPSLTLGLIVFATTFSAEQTRFFSAVSLKSVENLYAYSRAPDNPEVVKTAEQNGNAQRISIIAHALSLVKRYPVQGAGLGSALFFQEKETGRRIDVIDCTPLWILTEMGLIGFCAFIGGGMAAVIALYRRTGAFWSPQDNFSLCALLIVLIFVTFALFHELLYTRFLWFILGLALALPKTHPAQQDS